MDNRKKITLIGPVYPYKGGIAHNTSLLYRVLSKEHDVTVVSYKMQYPHFLHRQEQKDYGSDLFRVDGSQFLINTANPVNIVAVGKGIKREGPDLVIFQWWHPYFAPCYWILTHVLGRKIPVMFVCHNVFPHERFPLDRLLTKAVLKKGHSFIVFSQSDGRELLTVKPDARFRRNPIPIFNVFKRRGLTREQARDLLGEGLDTHLLLFFGFVREYKGLRHLLCAMPEIGRRVQNVRLLVVGAFSSDREQYVELIRELHVEDHVRLVDDYVPDDEVEQYFAACDLVMLPYESATQSGIVQIAYAFEKPVVCTNVGGLPDVVEDGMTGYVVEPRDPLALANAVSDYFVEDRGVQMHEAVCREKYRFDWDRMLEQVDALMGWDPGRDGQPTIPAKGR